MALAETAKLIVALALDDKLTGPLGRVQSGLGQMGKGVGQVSAGLLRLGETAAVGAAGGIAFAAKEAIDFQAAMKLIQTQAGASAQEVDSMSAAVLGLAGAVGTTPEELAAGLFHVESAGFRGAQALDVLKIAAEGAKVGNADLESVTNALVGALNSGISGIDNTSEAMGVLNAVVGAGNLRMQDLAEAFGTGILSSAKSFGVSIQSIGAAIADLSRQGIPAVDAATRLRITLSLLAAPTPKAVKLLEGIGISANQLAEDMRGPDGILGAIVDLKTHLDEAGLSATEQATLLSRAFGGGRSSSALLALIGDVGKLRDVQNQVNASTGTFGESWAATQEDVRFQIDRLKANFLSMATVIGSDLLPVIGDLGQDLNDFLSKPETQDAIRAFGQNLASGIRDIARELKGTDFSGLIAGMKLAADAAKVAFDLFRSLPAPIQQLAIAAIVTNKVSGGAVGLIAKGLANIALGGLKTITAGNVTVIGGNVTGGGAPGVGGVAAAGERLSATTLLGIFTTALAGFAIGGAIGGPVQEQTVKPAREFETGVVDKIVNSQDTTREELVKAIGTIDDQMSSIISDPINRVAAGTSIVAGYFTGQPSVTDVLQSQRAALEKQLAAMDAGTARETAAADAWGARLTAQAEAIKLATLQADANERGRANAALAAQNLAAEQARLTAANTAEAARWGGLAQSQLSTIAGKNFSPTVQVNVPIRNFISVNGVLQATTSAWIASSQTGSGPAPDASVV